MKRLLNIANKVLMGITFMACMACSAIPYDPPPPPIPTQSMKASLVMDNVNFNINDNLQEITLTSYLDGTGTMINGVTTHVTLHQSHLAVVDRPNHMKIENGLFEIKNESGDLLTGTYEGTGSFNDLKDLFSADLSMTITGGTGHYQNSSGTLQGKLSPSEDNLKVYVLKIYSQNFITIPPAD